MVCNYRPSNLLSRMPAIMKSHRSTTRNHHCNRISENGGNIRSIKIVFTITTPSKRSTSKTQPTPPPSWKSTLDSMVLGLVIGEGRTKKHGKGTNGTMRSRTWCNAMSWSIPGRRSLGPSAFGLARNWNGLPVTILIDSRSNMFGKVGSSSFHRYVMAIWMAFVSLVRSNRCHSTRVRH